MGKLKRNYYLDKEISDDEKYKIYREKGLDYLSTVTSMPISQLKTFVRNYFIRNCLGNDECTYREVLNDIILSDKELIDSIIQFYYGFGRFPLAKDFINIGIYKKRFGSWENAINAAKVELLPKKREEIKKLLNGKRKLNEG